MLLTTKNNTLSSTRSEYNHAHLYDLFGDHGSSQQPDVNFFLSYAIRAGEALEIGAGTGRIAIPVAEHGIPIWVVEPSAQMRSFCLNKTLYKPHTRTFITVLGGDASSFAFKRRFRLIYTVGVHVHILTDAEHLAVLRNIYEHLSDDGVFVFSLVDIDPQEWYDRPLHVVDSKHIGEIEYRRMQGQEMTTGNTCKYRTVYQAIYKGEIIERVENHAEGYFITREQMHEFLSQSGFRILNEYADFAFAPYKGKGNRVIVEAQKA